MALPRRLGKKKFYTRLKRVKEELRVLRERSNFLIKKIKKAEKAREKLIKNIMKNLGTWNYDELVAKLEELNNIMIKRELPATKISISLINNHVAYIGKEIGSANPDEILEGTKKLFDYYAELQKLMLVRVDDLKDEGRVIQESIRNGVPLREFGRLQADELREHTLDRHLKAMRSKFAKSVHNLEKRAEKITYSQNKSD
tara:strand:- start:360 stop:959 length:600 start_codon:yes stop_codon:yes gene_type:complete